MINIKDLDKAAVLVALYERSRPQGLGMFAAGVGESLSLQEARDRLAQYPSVDYLRGRPIKIDFSENEIDPWLYDRDMGAGAAAQAIAALREKLGKTGS